MQPRHVVFASVAVAIVVGGVVMLATRDDVEPGTGSPRTEAQLRYRLLARFHPVFSCDPDFFPVGRPGGEEASARTWWSAAAREGDEVRTIRQRLAIVGDPDDAQVLAMYRERKRLQSMTLSATSAGFRFDLRQGTEADAMRIMGAISTDGAIRVTSRAPEMTSCPICLSGRARIATPAGEVAVADLRVGDAVWTVDAAGARVAGTVLRTVARAVATPHTFVRITLRDGRTVTASPGHPTVGGRAFGALRVGDGVDGSVVVEVRHVASNEGFTYDVLTSGVAGAYWADGVLIGSTLS